MVICTSHHRRSLLFGSNAEKCKACHTYTVGTFKIVQFFLTFPLFSNFALNFVKDKYLNKIRSLSSSTEKITQPFLTRSFFGFLHNLMKMFNFPLKINCTLVSANVSTRLNLMSFVCLPKCNTSI